MRLRLNLWSSKAADWPVTPELAHLPVRRCYYEFLTRTGAPCSKAFVSAIGA